MLTYENFSDIPINTTETIESEMKLEVIFPVIVAVLYLATGGIHAGKGNWATAGLWISYAIANCFIIASSGKGH